MRWRAVATIFKESFLNFFRDDVFRLAAALAYYTIFSIAPLLVFVVWVAGAFFGEAAVRGELIGQFEGLVGEEGARLIQDLMVRIRFDDLGSVASILGAAALLFGASGAFFQLQWALNKIWEVEPRSSNGLKGLVRARLVSMVMVFGIGFLLIVSLVVSTGLAAVTHQFENRLPDWGVLWPLFYVGTSFFTSSLLFAYLFKFLPDARIAWKDVLVGAGITAALFAIGQFLLGLYLGRGTFASTYGAAGSFVTLLLWTYYSSSIVLLGAEFTKAYAKQFGSRIRDK